MATAKISEDYLSRPFQLGLQSGRELVFDVVGAADNDIAGVNEEDEVYQLLNAAAPAAYNGLALDQVDAEPLGNGTWKCVARYIRLQTEYSFDTGSGTQHITQSMGTTIWGPPTAGSPDGSGNGPDFQGAIGVTKDSVEGVDVTVPNFEWSETHYLEPADVTEAYVNTLIRLTGCVNSQPFGPFTTPYDPGQVLFLGATGQQRSDLLWPLTYRFAGSPNATNIEISPTITVGQKNGWDYLWILYADTADTTAYALVKRPVAAYVEQVYPYDDLNDLVVW